MAASKDHSNAVYNPVFTNVHPDIIFPGTPGNTLQVGSLPPDMGRRRSYEGLSGEISGGISDGTTSLMNIDFSSLPDEFDENSRKETEILNMNR
jgi:hypothetical protein